MTDYLWSLEWPLLTLRSGHCGITSVLTSLQTVPKTCQGLEWSSNKNPLKLKLLQVREHLWMRFFSLRSHQEVNHSTSHPPEIPPFRSVGFTIQQFLYPVGNRKAGPPMVGVKINRLWQHEEPLVSLRSSWDREGSTWTWHACRFLCPALLYSQTQFSNYDINANTRCYIKPQPLLFFFFFFLDHAAIHYRQEDGNWEK